MDWPTILTSLSTAVLAAFLTPRFQYVTWKKQKLREERLSLAQRFSALNTNLRLLANVTPPIVEDPTRIAEEATKFLEQSGLLVNVMVLFERPDTLASADALNKWLRVPMSSREYPAYLKNLYALRVDLSTRLFAEAFDISTEAVRKRSGALAVGSQ